jgi:hypothetical protein
VHSRHCRHPSFTIHTDLMDAHVYMFSRWVIDILAEKQNMSSIQGELVPFLVAAQFAEIPETWQKLAASAQTQHNAINMSHCANADRKMDLVSCYAYVAPPTTFCARVNTLPSYISANSYVSNCPVSNHMPWLPILETNYVEDAQANNPEAHVSCDFFIAFVSYPLCSLSDFPHHQIPWVYLAFSFSSPFSLYYLSSTLQPFNSLELSLFRLVTLQS